MAKVPAFAKAFAGRWRIVEMDVWDNDVLDLGEEAHLSFEGASNGEIAFVAVKGFLDVRYGSRDGAACAEFSWQGYDDADGHARNRRTPGRPHLHPSGRRFRLRLRTRLSSSTAC